jgi:putative CocE/NonD family hydrolase
MLLNAAPFLTWFTHQGHFNGEMMFRTIRLIGAAMAVAVLFATMARANAQAVPFFLRPSVASPHAAPTFAPIPGIRCKTQYVAMRDGTLLSTDVYLPEQAGQYPVILERSPYAGPSDHGCFAPGLELPVTQFALHGYAVVFQLVRGTSVSGGHFDPFIQEINDQYDATEWAASQSWSTGRVGTTGVSYLGIDQWMGAIARPPHLYAINPDVAGSDFHDSPVYEQGDTRWSDALNYPPDFIPDGITRVGIANGTPAATIAAEITNFENAFGANLSAYTYTTPLASMNAFQPYPEADFFHNWASHPLYDAFWEAQDVEVHWPQITVPALIGGASIDLFNIGAIRNYQGMRNLGGSPAARRGTKLYWQAYGHAGDSGTPTFGSDALPFAPYLGGQVPTGELLAFFDHYLKGLNNGYENMPNATIYVLVPPNAGETGSGFWLSANDFPLPGTRTRRLFLESKGHANSRLGDGFLNEADGPKRFRAPSDQFVYDPRNPVPTVGGNLLAPDTLTHKNGFQDQSTVELRNDVLVYTSAPLTRDMAVIGTVDASFWAMTSAADTDFTVKLVDVHPDGLTNNVMDRVVRASLRLGSKLPPISIQRNKPYQYMLEVGNTASIFPAHHRVRVEISSSNFPKFARNLNTTQLEEFQNRFEVANQTILHDAVHRSFIDLPVAPRVQVP